MALRIFDEGDTESTLEEAVRLLKEARTYIDDTHGYDSEIYELISDFLDEIEEVEE